MTDPRAHSAAYLSDIRNHFWNADYLDLLARRLRLHEVHRLLDIGCGQGHWTQCWIPRLAPGACVTGVDFEARWVAAARERLGREFPDTPAEFVAADATALPFADDTFDAVTCQTLLMHVPEPERVVAEMVRVVRPGGLVFCAEPNYMMNMVVWNDAYATRPVDDIACVFAFWVHYMRGKKATGRGDDTIGDRLPALLGGAGLVDIGAQRNDRTFPFAAPYQQASRQYFDWAESMRTAGEGPWDAPKMRARVLAGGGDEQLFERAFALLHAWADDDAARIAAGSFTSGGGMTIYLVSGRKPVR